MRLAAFVASAFLCPGFAVAQTFVVHPFQLQPALTALEERDSSADVQETAERLVAMLGKLVQLDGVDGRANRRIVQLVKSRGATLLLVRSEQKDIDLVDGVLAQLKLPAQPELQVQCTRLTMPTKLAAAHGLLRKQPKPVDEVAAGEILKQCIQEGGTLQNLPEGRALPLQPFVMAPPELRAGPKPVRTWSVQCEGVMVDPDSAAFSVRLVEDKPKANAPNAERIAETFRIDLGTGVMLASHPQVQPPAPDQTIVLWFRFVSAEVPKRADEVGKVGQQDR